MSPHVELLDPAMVAVYMAMSPTERLQAGLAATNLVRLRLRAHIQHEHPEWDKDWVDAAVAERMLRGGG